MRPLRSYFAAAMFFVWLFAGVSGVASDVWQHGWIWKPARAAGEPASLFDHVMIFGLLWVLAYGLYREISDWLK